MRETPKAKQAWNDYLGMGEGRSIDKLFALYQSGTKSAPATRLRTLKDWSVAHCWQSRLAAIADAEQAAIVKRGIADKQNRVDAYNDRWHRMQAVIQARAEKNADLTGGDTGLVVREVTYLPSGGSRERHEVDTGLLKELREHEKQAAQELGQWVEKTEDNGQRQITVEYVNDWRGAKGDPAGAPSRAADGTEPSEAV